MPTGRAYSFVIAALLFYFFANQTQVGWLYVISALLLGLVLAAYVLNRRALRDIIAERDLASAENYHEGDTVTITLTLRNQRQLPAVQVRAVEKCPLAAPDADARSLKMFIPTLSTFIAFDYKVAVYRRGVHTFPALNLQTRAPFGFFQQQTTLPVDTRILAYPLVNEIQQLDLLDRQLAAEMTNTQAGRGSEVMGIRPYRRGDSPRYIHWRSVARRGRLVSKEFAEETQPGVTVVLDRYQPFDDDRKHTPFEMAVKCATSLADYALRQQYPVYLAADAEGCAMPRGAIVREVLMQYLARVPYRTESALADVLTYQPMQQFIAIALSYPDDALLEPLRALSHRGARMLVTVPNPALFPTDDDTDAAPFVAQLQQMGIATRLIQYGDDWAQIISTTDSG